MADIIRFPRYVTVAKFPNGFGREAEITFRKLASANLHPEWRHGPGVRDSSLVVPESEEADAIAYLIIGSSVSPEHLVFDNPGSKGRHRPRTLAAFVKEHRQEITETMRAVGIVGSINDEDRRNYVKNDHTLYMWAKSEGVLE